MATQVYTRDDVAKLAGVSKTTVTNVLGSKKKSTHAVEQRVLNAAKKLKYQPNLVARGLKTKNTKQIGVLISELSNPYFVDVLNGIEEEAALRGYSVSIYLIKGDVYYKYQDLMGRRFAGVINLSNIPYTEELVGALQNLDAKLVCFEPSYSSQVGFEAADAIKEIMQNMYNLSHRKISYLVGLPQVVADKDERVRAYLDEYAAMGFEEHENKIVYGDFPIQNSETLGKLAVDYLYQGNCDITGILCINDMMALGALKALSDKGLKVPQDVSVTGCDNIAISQYMIPSLTTIDVPRYEVGRSMMQEMSKLINGNSPRRVLLQGKLIMRDSLSNAKIFKNN